MKALKIAGIVLGSLIVLVLIIAGIAVLLLRSSSGIARQVTPVPISAPAADSFDTKLDAFEKTAKESSPGTPVTLTLTEEEVNSKIAEGLADADLPSNIKVNDVVINLRDGGALASAKVSVSGVQVDVGAKVAIEVVNGEAVVQVSDLDLGKLPLPQSVKDQITGLIPDDGKINLSDLPVNLKDLVLANGQITLSGVTR